METAYRSVPSVPNRRRDGMSLVIAERVGHHGTTTIYGSTISVTPAQAGRYFQEPVAPRPGGLAERLLHAFGALKTCEDKLNCIRQIKKTGLDLHLLSERQHAISI